LPETAFVMTDPTVLVLGASGRFGRAAVQAFSRARWRTFAQFRGEPGELPPGVVPIRASLEDIGSIVSRAAGTGIVVHAANPPYSRWRAQLLPMAEQAIRIATRLRASLMMPGNVYGFGESMPAVLGENTPEQPSTRKGHLRVALEARLRAAARDGKLASVVILRAGDFYGSGTGSWLDLAILKSRDRGRLVYPGPLDVPHAWAYLPDLARAFVAVARYPKLRPFENIHFPGHTLTGTALLDAVEKGLATLGALPAGGLQRTEMPWLAMRLGSPFVPMLREVVEMRYLWNEPHALSGTRLAELASDLPTTPVDEAMLAALRALGVAATPR
jgi:nucleoside-diphosphate-sugar epimerase